MHIYKKLLKVYSESEIRDKMDKNIFSDLKNARKSPSLDSLANKFDLSKIGYTLKMFLEDYPKYKEFAEKYNGTCKQDT